MCETLLNRFGAKLTVDSFVYHILHYKNVWNTFKRIDVTQNDLIILGFFMFRNT